ncbi:hypothetical protein LOK49_LG11G00305 [Camellia lanceoleosa]|uniref:Uncharacterized protein n=1 Tax=Camellia lanceoleosa TaxID=1840588 RepID=A0ACC0G203_9ERIC|nr:hypothetical protein LOK49_LG11G00305 [Camellia lanceoleosa]
MAASTQPTTTATTATLRPISAAGGGAAAAATRTPPIAAARAPRLIPARGQVLRNLLTPTQATSNSARLHVTPAEGGGAAGGVTRAPRRDATRTPRWIPKRGQVLRNILKMCFPCLCSSPRGSRRRSTRPSTVSPSFS